MEKLEERVIRLEGIVDAMKDESERRDKEWERFLKHDDLIHARMEKSVEIIRKKVNGWFYFSLGVAAAGGGILAKAWPF